MRNQEWDPALSQLNSLDLCQLVFCLFSGDTVDGETTLCVIDEAKVLSSFFNGNNVHEASWIGRIGTDFAVDFY